MSDIEKLKKIIGIFEVLSKTNPAAAIRKNLKSAFKYLSLLQISLQDESLITLSILSECRNTVEYDYGKETVTIFLRENLRPLLDRLSANRSEALKALVYPFFFKYHSFRDEVKCELRRIQAALVEKGIIIDLKQLSSLKLICDKLIEMDICDKRMLFFAFNFKDQGLNEQESRHLQSLRVSYRPNRFQVEDYEETLNELSSLFSRFAMSKSASLTNPTDRREVQSKLVHWRSAPAGLSPNRTRRECEEGPKESGKEKEVEGPKGQRISL